MSLIMKILRFFKFVLIIHLFLCDVDTARILAIYPILAHSHFTYYEAIMTALNSVGHEITFFSPFPSTKMLENFTMIDSRLQKTGNRSPCSRNFKSTYWLRWMYDTEVIHEKNCYDLMQLEDMRKILNSPERNFDLMFVAPNQMYECYLPIAEKLDIPVIVTSAFRWFEFADIAVGNPRNPAAIPFDFGCTSKSMTFIDRLENTFNRLAIITFYYFIEKPLLNQFYQKYFPDFDPSTSIKISALFLNSHSSIFSRPLVPNAFEIGGIHISPEPSTLPVNIKNFIDDAEHGVILFTFGSITKSKVITAELRSLFRDTFAEIPERVIWKFEEKIDGLTDNVLLADWVPQRDILAHPNVKAFLTHCGLLGVEEAIYEAKPMIMIPFFVDQAGNAALLDEHGVGINLDFRSLTKTKLLNAIRNVLDVQNYTENVKSLSKRFKDRPMSADKTVIYWTEYVLKSDRALHLRTVGADMPWYQYLLIDVVAFLVSIVISFVVLILLITRKIFTFFGAKSKTNTNLKKKKRE